MSMAALLSLRTKLLKLCRRFITFGGDFAHLSNFDAAEKLCRDVIIDGGRHRTNVVGIQMLPESLRHKIFGSCIESSADEEKRLAIENHLKKHDLLGKKTTVQEIVDLPLPPLHGANIDAHFRTIATQQTLPYRENAKRLAATSLPPQPEQWIMREGWTKYDFVNKRCYAVDYPDEQAVVLDVEVLIPEGNYPAIVTAASATAWYSWCSKRLFEKSVNSANCLLSLDDLVPLEICNHEYGATACQRQIPRLIVGHNVSFDRSFIKEQYFIQGSKTRFLDTMSLHIAISGLTSLQRILYVAKKAGSKRKEVLEHEDEVSKFGIYPVLLALGFGLML